MISATPLPILEDNYTWIVSVPGSSEAVVIDPGEAAPVASYLKARRLHCAAVLLTHHHWDHIGGAAALAVQNSCPVYGPGLESIPAVTKPLDDGDRISVTGLQFEVLSVPGHTRGHLCYVGHGLILSGDTLFAGGCGRIFEGTPEQMFRSLSRLASLDGKLKLCCGHEYTLANLRFARTVDPDSIALATRFEDVSAIRRLGGPSVPSRLDEERATNPFLRCHTPAIVDAVSHHVGRSLDGDVAVFAELRRWKDGFKPARFDNKIETM